MNIADHAEAILTLSFGVVIVAALVSCYARFFRKMCRDPQKTAKRRISIPADSVTNITLISRQQTESDIVVNSANNILTEDL